MPTVAKSSVCDYPHNMSASDLVKQVRAMPRRERRRVVRAILAMKEQDTDLVRTREKQVKWPDIEARARRIFGSRAIPNLVLLEREDETL